MISYMTNSWLLIVFAWTISAFFEAPVFCVTGASAQELKGQEQTMVEPVNIEPLNKESPVAGEGPKGIELGSDYPEAIQQQVQRISDSIMSPYCPGMTLSACPSPDARALRLEIGGWLMGGKDNGQVMMSLAERYGEKIKAVPSDDGGVYRVFALTPIVVIGVGTLLSIFYLFYLRGKKDYQDIVER